MHCDRCCHKAGTKEMIKVSDPYLEEVLEHWAEINFEQQIISKINFQERVLWSINSQFTLKIGLKKKITKVKHLQKTKIALFYLSMPLPPRVSPPFLGFIIICKIPS